MSDDPFRNNPLMSAWVDAQSKMLDAQTPFWEGMSRMATSTDPSKDLVRTSETLWENALAQGRDWMAQFDLKTGMPGDQGGVAKETLQRMMDPSQFLYAGSDEINQTIQKLVEGPEFADIGTLERQALRATKEWLVLREASAEYRMITAKAWGRTFERYTKSMQAKPALWKESPRALLKMWMETANDELLTTQRTDEFLKAQRKLLRAGVDYRIREREMVEVWCEAHSMPTRTEVDDLHATVYQLRRDIRAMKKELAALRKPTPRVRKAATRKPAARSKS